MRRRPTIRPSHHSWPPGHFTELMRLHDWPPGWRVLFARRAAEEAAEQASPLAVRRRSWLAKKSLEAA